MGAPWFNIVINVLSWMLSVLFVVWIFYSAGWRGGLAYLGVCLAVAVLAYAITRWAQRRR